MSQESRTAARRIVEDVLAAHAAADAVSLGAFRPMEPVAADDPARVTARRIVTEVLTAYAARQAAEVAPESEAGTVEMASAAGTDEVAPEARTAEAPEGATVGMAAEAITVETSVDEQRPGDPTVDRTTEVAAEAVDDPAAQPADDPTVDGADASAPGPDADRTRDQDTPVYGHHVEDEAMPADRGGNDAEQEPASGPPPLPVAVLERAGADDVQLYDEPQIILQPVFGSQPDTDEPARRPYRVARWLVATVLAAVALTVLLPMAVAALRDLVAL